MPPTALCYAVWWLFTWKAGIFKSDVETIMFPQILMRSIKKYSNSALKWRRKSTTTCQPLEVNWYKEEFRVVRETWKTKASSIMRYIIDTRQDDFAISNVKRYSLRLPAQNFHAISSQVKAISTLDFHASGCLTPIERESRISWINKKKLSTRLDDNLLPDLWTSPSTRSAALNAVLFHPRKGILRFKGSK